MLALSASDMAASEHFRCTPELGCVAISNRVKAITSLKEAIGKPIQSVEQGNAMIAACFSLLFQSTLIDDGIVEYMTFVRGVLVVSQYMGKNNIGFIFEHMFYQPEVVEKEINPSPLINPEHASRACRSLEQIRPLIQNRAEIELYGHLLSAARSLFTSSPEGTLSLDRHFHSLISLVHFEAEPMNFMQPIRVLPRYTDFSHTSCLMKSSSSSSTHQMKPENFYSHISLLCSSS
jgi:hypothetical protein